METEKLKALKPYLFITFCGLLAYAPVSLMAFALKNDIVALEYPINHFMSQCLRNGEWPLWFNTWGMGFPLQSNLTWGVFSTPQIIFSSVFNYNIISLHIEFLFFILLAGWSMFHLLKKHFLVSEQVGTLLSLGYMLSGFVTGSSQWLLYITAASFLPLLISSVLDLLKKPGFFRALQLAVVYTLMFTSVYAAFNIIITYGLLVFLLIEITRNSELIKRRLIYLGITALITAALCGPVLMFTVELLGQLERGKGLTSTGEFFNSNYLHPAALQSMLFPFASVKMPYTNTEGAMLNSYAGLFALTMLVPASLKIFKSRNRNGILLLIVALFCLLFSFGDLLPFRQALNLLPGFSYFRNPAIFRFFFITSIILAVATAYKEEKFSTLFNTGMIKWIIAVFILLSLMLLVRNYGTLDQLDRISVMSVIKSLRFSQALFIAALVQLPFLLIGILSIIRKYYGLAYWIFVVEMVINTVICTPFFTVSSYTPSEVNSILKITPGFPVQQETPSKVMSTKLDDRQNLWQNVNVFSKQVSSNSSYRGPLVLNQKLPGIPGAPLVFAPFDSSAVIEVTVQRPSHVQVRTSLKDPTVLTLSQNHYPGWKVYVNGNKSPLVACYNPVKTNKGGTCPPGLSVVVSAGNSTVDYYYERKAVVYSAIWLHLVILSWLLWKIVSSIKRLTRSSSPSLQY